MQRSSDMSAALLLRAEPRGEAFRDLLLEGGARGANLGLVLDREPPDEWAGFVAAAVRRESTRSYPDARLLDPVTVIELEVTDQVVEAGIRLIDEPGADVLLIELGECAPQDCAVLLSVTLSEGPGTYQQAAETLCAAVLVVEAVAPETVGDIGWGLVGTRPDDLEPIRRLVPAAIVAARDVASRREWRSGWTRYGFLPEALAEVEWLIAQATSVLSASTLPVRSLGAEAPSAAMWPGRGRA